MATTISVDSENNAEQWWDGVREAAEQDSVSVVLLWLLDVGGPDSITVPDTEAERIRSWVMARPGWYGGPDYAPHPLRFEKAG